MTDKVQKIREDVEKLKSQLLRGACSSQVAMETMCKEEAYNEVLAILDTMQKESNKIKFNVGDTIKNKDGYEVTIESIGDDCYFVDKAQACIKFSTQDQWELVEEPVSGDLEKAAEEYATSVDFAGNKTIVGNEVDAFKAGAKWQKEKDDEEKVLTYKHGFEDFIDE